MIMLGAFIIILGTSLVISIICNDKKGHHDKEKIKMNYTLTESYLQI